MFSSIFPLPETLIPNFSSNFSITISGKLREKFKISAIIVLFRHSRRWSLVQFFSFLVDCFNIGVLSLDLYEKTNWIEILRCLLILRYLFNRLEVVLFVIIRIICCCPKNLFGSKFVSILLSLYLLWMIAIYVGSSFCLRIILRLLMIWVFGLLHQTICFLAEFIWNLWLKSDLL